MCFAVVALAVSACGGERSANEANPEAQVETIASGEMRLDSLLLKKSGQTVERHCRKAARGLSFKVLCPSVLPSGWDEVSRCSPCNGMFILSGYFAAAEFSSESGKGAGHLSIWASPPEGTEELFVGCPRGEQLGTADVDGRRARWTACPSGSAIDSGHLLLEWTEGEITYAVSLHGEDSELNRAVLQFVAEQLAEIR